MANGKNCNAPDCTMWIGLDKDGYCPIHVQGKCPPGVIDPETPRKNRGKPKVGKTMLMPEALSGLAWVIEFGEEKYTPAENKGWMKYNPGEVLDSMMRHAVAARNGEHWDPESGLPHAYHMLFNAAVYVELTCRSSGGSGEPTLHGDSTEN